MSNKAQCLICGMILESKHHHDFKCCTCGNLCVDGGNDYQKRSIKFPNKYLELSEDKVEVSVENIRSTYEHIQKITGVK